MKNLATFKPDFNFRGYLFGSILMIFLGLWNPINSLSQELGGEQSCDGGSCTYTEYVFGEARSVCSACCPSGKSPSCTSFGCSCTP